MNRVDVSCTTMHKIRKFSSILRLFIESQQKSPVFNFLKSVFFCVLNFKFSDLRWHVQTVALAGFFQGGGGGGTPTTFFFLPQFFWSIFQIQRGVFEPLTPPPPCTCVQNIWQSHYKVLIPLTSSHVYNVHSLQCT